MCIFKQWFKKPPLKQSAKDQWRERWQQLVPPECRNVPITVDGVTVVAYIQINHYVMMLQDGLLMEKRFFDVCEHFQKAGFHVVWLMRCTQDIHDGYLKRLRHEEESNISQWYWKKPTTNFGRWTEESKNVTILLQTYQLPAGISLSDCTAPVICRVRWADSDEDDAEMVPSKTYFTTVAKPGTPKELCEWLQGELLRKTV